MKFKKSRHNSVVEASAYTNECFVAEKRDEFLHIAGGRGHEKSKTNNASVRKD